MSLYRPSSDWLFFEKKTTPKKEKNNIKIISQFKFINTWIKEITIKKSHTCEKGGAHLRISFWHLLMNFKNKY